MAHDAYRFMLEGSGIRLAASARHADVLLVTSPVSGHMETALKRVYGSISRSETGHRNR